MAGGKCVRGAEVIVFALRRSVRSIFPEEGTGDPSPTRVFDIAPLYRQNT